MSNEALNAGSAAAMTTGSATFDGAGWLHSLRHSTLGYPFWQYWIDCQDPRTADFFLVNTNPYLFCALMYCYVHFATKLGPRLMKHRKPFDLKPLMLVYNVAMALTNAYFVTLVVLYCDGGRRFLDWKYPDRSDVSPQARWELDMAWWYWMTKFLDLLDTVFFVLRKKHETHITFLHLYHHTSVPIFGYLCLKHNAIMPCTGLFALINGTIHVIMYSYYALAALGPAIRPYLWWKRYITQMQLGQFVFGMFWGLLMVFKQEGYPQFWFWFGMTQPPLFYYMFRDFYRRAYEQKQKEEQALRDKAEAEKKKET